MSVPSGHTLFQMSVPSNCASHTMCYCSNLASNRFLTARIASTCKLRCIRRSGITCCIMHAFHIPIWQLHRAQMRSNFTFQGAHVRTGMCDSICSIIKRVFQQGWHMLSCTSTAPHALCGQVQCVCCSMHVSDSLYSLHHSGLDKSPPEHV